MNKIFTTFFILLFIITFQSCHKNPVNNPVGNQAPHTGVFLYPDSTISKQPSKINVHWWGDDPDGFVIGYYFSWNGKQWAFTKSNDSLFSLQIGIKDTTYTFLVSAVDNGGNGVYDNDIVENDVNYGPEPFTDLNGNGKYDKGEPFVDIGLIDPSPASIKFPIKNSPPTVEWSSLTFLPDTSFPVMSFAWNTADIDGDSTIQKINIALNDTSNSNNIVTLDGQINNITIRTKDFSSSNPMMDILIDGAESNVFSEKLPGLKLNGNNKFYVQAEDNSGAKSKFISIPDSGTTWYVKKPKGDLLIVKDYQTTDDAASFYAKMFDDSLGLTNKYDVYNFLDKSEAPPFENVTFLLTLELYKYVFWYTDNNPSLDLITTVTQKYMDNGGKIAFSLQFPQGIDLSSLQSFLPIITDSSDALLDLFAGVKISAQNTQPSYPDLELSSTIFRVKSFFVDPLAGIPIYYFPNKEMKGYIGFTDTDEKLFFIGLPLNKAEGGSANAKELLHKVLFQDFGLTTQ
jgi:hypothetical protein